MGIVIIRQDGKVQLWKEALMAIAPEIPVYGYMEEHPADEINVALVWKHPKGILKKYPNLKYIASNGAGVDFIFEDTSISDKLPITRVVDIMLASDMSEYVIAVIFSYLKNLNQYKADQLKGVWRPTDYHRIADFTVGVLGLGALGAVLAKDLVHFGFKTQGWSNSKKSFENVKTFSGKGELSQFLSSTQILVCLLPLTKKTSGVLNKELFKQLPKGAYIINVARGGHLVDTDLLEILDTGHLSGACLDVFHQEPLPADHSFWNHEKINITPHYASVSDTAEVVPQIIENYKRMRKGEPLLNLVSRVKGY
ncbi:D-3-phosphoglycerate dehydrogenase [hydrothermal vent metagenome]|uniref:D-3-phosphoglycerate dehydrogenase n=1 Tax=hydrothermal vent metagenome TaxID=652676 RepID=A0A3B0TRG0_9ZZZZ